MLILSKSEHYGRINLMVRKDRDDADRKADEMIVAAANDGQYDVAKPKAVLGGNLRRHADGNIEINVYVEAD